MSKFEDLMSALATDAEQSFATPEDIQEIVNEYSGKDSEIAALKENLSAKEKEYEALKSRIVEHGTINTTFVGTFYMHIFNITRA